MTTTGFSSTDFNLWPALATMILLILMFIGGMAGSTAGGTKVSRLVIAVKGAYINVRKLINPRYVPKAKFEGKTIEEKTINDVFSYFTLYWFIFLGILLLLSIDPINGQSIMISSEAGQQYEVQHGFFSNFSATLSCLCNIGPGFEAVGAYSSFAEYSVFSKSLLSLTMIVGRLEIFPVLILLNPRTWKSV